MTFDPTETAAKTHATIDRLTSLAKEYEGATHVNVIAGDSTIVLLTSPAGVWGVYATSKPLNVKNRASFAVDHDVYHLGAEVGTADLVAKHADVVTDWVRRYMIDTLADIVDGVNLESIQSSYTKTELSDYEQVFADTVGDANDISTLADDVTEELGRRADLEHRLGLDAVDWSTLLFSNTALQSDTDASNFILMASASTNVNLKKSIDYSSGFLLSDILESIYANTDKHRMRLVNGDGDELTFTPLENQEQSGIVTIDADVADAPAAATDDEDGHDEVDETTAMHDEEADDILGLGRHLSVPPLSLDFHAEDAGHDAGDEHAEGATSEDDDHDSVETAPVSVDDATATTAGDADEPVVMQEDQHEDEQRPTAEVDVDVDSESDARDVEDDEPKPADDAEGVGDAEPSTVGATPSEPTYEQPSVESVVGDVPDVDSLLVGIARTRKTMEDIRRAQEHVRKEVDAAQARLDALKAERQVVSARIEKLPAAQPDIDGKIASVGARRDDIKSQIESLQDEVQRLDDEERQLVAEKTAEVDRKVLEESAGRLDTVIERLTDALKF
jgi:archaellum component FlaC